RHAFVPTLDDLALSDHELEGLSPIHGAVELLSLRAVLPEPAGVVHHTGLAGLGRGPSSHHGVLVLKPGRRLVHLRTALLLLILLVGDRGESQRQAKRREQPKKSSRPGHSQSFLLADRVGRGKACASLYRGMS